MSNGLRRILRSNEVLSLTGYSNMHSTRLEAAGRFPKRFKISSTAKSGHVGWWLDEVQAWLNERDQKRQQPAPQPNAAA